MKEFKKGETKRSIKQPLHFLGSPLYPYQKQENWRDPLLIDAPAKLFMALKSRKSRTRADR